MTNRENHRIKMVFKQLREWHGGCCMYCGSEERLHFAHFKETELNGRGRGRKERYYDILKNPDAYILLCRRHHKQFDRGIITIKVVPVEVYLRSTLIV